MFFQSKMFSEEISVVLNIKPIHFEYDFNRKRVAERALNTLCLLCFTVFWASIVDASSSEC